MFCPYCGQRLAETDNFCTRCGRRLPPARPAASSPAALPAEPPRRRPSAPARPRPSTGVLVAMAVGSALLLAAMLVACVAPVVELPLLAGASTTTSDVMGVVLASVDPSLSVAIGTLLDVKGLNSFDVARLGFVCADVLPYGMTAVWVGLALGLALVAVALGLGGIVSSLVLGRPTPVLVAGAACVAAVCVAGLVAVAWVDGFAVSELRNGLSLAFAQMGVQLPEAVRVTAATPFLSVAAVTALVSFFLAAGARRAYVRRLRGPNPVVGM